MTVAQLPIQHNVPIPTWFGVGGGADALAKPRTQAELIACLETDADARILGDGANLLVHDDGVEGLVIDLAQGSFMMVEPVEGQDDSAETVLIRAGAGANLPKMIIESVRLGLEGIEGLGGIPATIGGALVMNAGGTFGQIADVVARVHALDRDAKPVTLERDQIAFGYRTSGLNDLVLTSCELQLRRADPKALRTRLKEVMAYKKSTQPMGDDSAGCCYKNPTLERAVEDIGDAGQRVGAGLLIDRAGCKGLTVGGASVSQRHANFFPVEKDAKASDVIALMEEVERRVLETYGIALQREVVVWTRDRIS